MSAACTEMEKAVPEQQQQQQQLPVLQVKEEEGYTVPVGDAQDDQISNPANDLALEDEVGDQETVVAPTNPMVSEGPGQPSLLMQSSSESLSDDAQQAGQEAAVPTSCTSPAAVQNTSATGDKGKATGKENKKEEKKKSKKKEDKSIEYILRALNSLHSPEEKLAALCKKYADLHEEHRVLQTSFKTQQRTMAVVIREKDQLQSEHTKAMMAKSKLESLCRELQKHNKIIKDESIKRAREEDERRKEISSQFQNTIGEIQAQMTDNTERSAKLRQENTDLAAHLQSIVKQCDTREQQMEKVRKHNELIQQLGDAKLAKSELQLKEERERNAREKELLVQKFTEQAKKNSMLESQVEMFKERYDDFEKLHSRSNETFQKYKTEMDKMTKRIKKLEKDGLQWKAKWEASNKALMETVESRNKSEKETLVYAQKCKKLESLCRALQAELHGKKPDEDTGGADVDNNKQQMTESPPAASSTLANSPEAAPLSDPCSAQSSEAPNPPSPSNEESSPELPVPSSQATAAPDSSSSATATASSSSSSPSAVAPAPSISTSPGCAESCDFTGATPAGVWSGGLTDDKLEGASQVAA